MRKIRSFKDLDVWQRSVDFAVVIYEITERFPSTESFGLAAQMRRASVSVASNIAEGFGRSSKEFSRYLQIALGSVAELETQIEIANRVGLLTNENGHQLETELTIIGKQLTMLRQKIIQSSK
jgi:four helix bundle protein